MTDTKPTTGELFEALQKPLTTIEQAELSFACSKMLTADGMLLLRRLLWSADALKTELAAIKSQTVPEGYADIKDYIAEQEKDPVRKAALDKARARLREELAKQPVPVEPESWRLPEDQGGCIVVEKVAYDSLQSALKVAQGQRDWFKDVLENDAGRLMNVYRQRAEKAEASNKRLVELFTSDAALQKAGGIVGTMDGYDGLSPDADHFNWFKAMSAELLREAGK